MAQVEIETQTADGHDNAPGFERLSRHTQIRRLRQLAELALADYDLPPARLILVADHFNFIFRVGADGPLTGQSYVLRIHRAGTRTMEEVESELAWLTALRRDTLLEVPQPVPTRADRLLTTAATPHISQPHICVLFRWLPGQRLHRGLTPRHLVRVGAFMAHLHNHACRWELPPGFSRGRSDWPIEAARRLSDPFAPEIITSIQALVTDTLSAAEAAQVVAVLARVRAVESLLAAETAEHKGPAAFGLIHADLHYGNLLFSRDTVRAIDFDDCGFGTLLFDPAVMLSAIWGWKEYPALRAALLAGYRGVRPLPAEHEAHIDAFIALRRVQDALWMLETREPVVGNNRATEARRALAPLRVLFA